MATIDRHLAGAAGLTAAKKAQYRAAAEKVLKAMGPKALERWNANVQSITFYPDTESLTRWADAKWPRDIQQKGRPRAGVCVVRTDRANQTRCLLHLDGGNDTGDIAAGPSIAVYAHEFAHAIDCGPAKGMFLSDSPDWILAWNAEGKSICRSLGMEFLVGYREGFGITAQFAWNNRRLFQRHHPRCWAFWSLAGLV
jgi:hypothetical protein